MPDPFTVEHFVAWAGDLTLDNDEAWVVEPFQAEFLADFFAGYPECWFILPEGNAKTTLLAGLALYHCEFRAMAFVPVAASARDQAEWMYRQAEGLVYRSQRLRQTFKCQEGYRRIKAPANGSRIQIFAADDRTGDGVIPTLALVDELHRHRDLRLYRTWRGKLLKRPGAQLVTISTAGEPGHEFEETREQIRQAATDSARRGCFLRAVNDDRLVLHEYALGEGDDPADMELVKQANPLASITVDQLREKHASPTMTPEHWGRFVCNLPMRGGNAAINEREWEAADAGKDIPEGVPVDVGLDVGWKWDTTAIVPLWTRDKEWRQFGAPRILVPPRDGSMLDGRDVEQAFLELHDRNPIDQVVMDMSRAEQLAQWLSDSLGVVVVDRVQTLPMQALDYSRFTEGLRLGVLKHSGHREFTRHVLNAVVKILPKGDGAFTRPSTGRLGPMQDMRVIDGLVAAAMVYSETTGPAVRPFVLGPNGPVYAA